MAVIATPVRPEHVEPLRTLCAGCGEPVLIAVVNEVDGDGRMTGGESVVVADIHEWEPRARCYACKNIESRSKVCPACKGLKARCARCGGSGEVRDKCANCNRCGGLRYVGRERPAGIMLAIDVAWGDEGHVRLIGPGTSRRKGEALHSRHHCNSLVGCTNGSLIDRAV